MADVIRLIETDLVHARPLLRLRSSFSFRDGILTRLERLRLQHPNARFTYAHPDVTHEALVAQSEAMEPARLVVAQTRSIQAPDPLAMLDQVGERISQDIALIGADAWNRAGAKVEVVGPAGDVFVHKSAVILPGVVIDTREGPVVVDSGAEVSSFSYLQGPLCVGVGSKIDNARITGGSIIGHSSRIGGEVENSIIQDFTNKHHEGFIGHSIIGSWVNLGALTTTSDLKNNYGEVRLKAPTEAIPALVAPKLETIQTGRIKLGSLVADCVKTSIGTMIGTGSILDTGANVFGGPPPVYVPPLAWGLSGQIYEPQRFVADCVKIFSRRAQKPAPNFETLIFRVAAPNGR